MGTKRRILFVDDEPNVLDAFRRLFLTMNKDWEMELVSNGKDALERMAKEPFDVLITDIRMSGMDGAELLQEANRRHPRIMRLVLSGFKDQESMLRCIGVTHQFLDKPCDAGLLQSRISGALALRDLLENETLQTLLSQVSSIPSMPAEYRQIMQELQSENASLDKVGKIIAKDIGMTAKVLQMVNSSFFGLRSRISSPEHAVRILGLETISSLVLMIGVFSQTNAKKCRGLDLSRLWNHSFSVGVLSKEIARAECNDRTMMEDSYTAGLLHAVGQLVMAELRKDYGEIVDAAQSQNVTLEAVEKEMIGATSSQIGAYLLALWGLPHAVVEAVGWQKHPSTCPNPEFSPLTTVHIADSLLNPMAHESPLDTQYLEQMWPDGQLAAKIESWKGLRPAFREAG
jgi:HD-like signal output (HDOD) protein/CheY-like chemotaxis protein